MKGYVNEDRSETLFFVYIYLIKLVPLLSRTPVNTSVE